MHTKVSDADIDEVLLAAPEFLLSLTVDRSKKRVPYAIGGERERDQGGVEEATTAAASSQSLPSDHES